MKLLISKIIIILGLISTGILHARTEMTVPNLFINSTSGQWEYIQSNIKYKQENLFILNWAGRGGLIFMGVDFIRSLMKARGDGKYIILRVYGNAISMHALSLCFASEVRVNNQNIYFMFHSAGDRKYRQDNSDYKWMFDECVRRGYAPSNVYMLVQQGYEVYYYPISGKIKLRQDPRPLW